MGTQAFTFNGVDFEDYGLIVTDFSDSLSASGSASMIRIPNTDRGYDAQRYSEPRIWTLNCVVAGSTEDVLISNVDSINYYLNSRTAKQWIHGWESLDDRYWMAKHVGRPQWRRINAAAYEVSLQFQASDPHAYSTTETTVSQAITSSPTSFGSGTVGGNAPAYPIWRISGVSGTITSIRVANGTVGTSLHWNTTLTSSYWRIDSSRWIVETSSDGSTWTASMTAVSATSNTFPYLSPRNNNSIVVTTPGVTGATFEIIYRARYL